MRWTGRGWVVLLTLVVGSSGLAAQEQEEPESHILTITTFKVPNTESQTFWSFVDKYIVPSDRENPHILSSRMGNHYWGDNEANIYLIAEYQDLAALQAAEDWTSDWTDEHYPEGTPGRDSLDTAFQEQFLPYFSDHRDQILNLNMSRAK